MLLLLTLFAAHADPPNREVTRFETGSVSDLAGSFDGRLVAAAVADGLYLVDTQTWLVGGWSGCDAAGVALQRIDDGEYTAWVGCEDGTLRVVDVDGVTATTDTSRTVTLDYDQIFGVHWDVSTEALFIIGKSDEDTAPSVVSVNSDDMSLSSTAVALVRTGYADSAVSNRRLFVLHSSDDVSYFDLGATVATTNTSLSVFSINDIAPSIRGSIYGADNTGVVTEFTTLWSALIPSVGDAANAVGVSDWDDDEWLMVARDSEIDVYGLNSGTPTNSSSPEETFSTDDSISDIIVAAEGYAFANAGSAMVVYSANPWIDDVSLSTSDAVDGDEVDLSFALDGAFSWSVRIGSTSGEEIDAGSLSAAGTVELSFTVDDRFEEGSNDIVVVGTDSAGRTGSRGASLVVDNPPPTPSLEVGFGNSSLLVNLGEAAVSDLATYQIYVSTQPFEAADYPTGGPTFDGDDALDTPISVAVAEQGDTTATISPLTNDVTYYIAARAVDEGGQESPMSAVVPGTPRPTYSATQRSGDQGGPACSHLPLSAMGLPIFLAAALVRRRRMVAGVAAGTALLVAAPARAELPTDDTEAHFNVELRYGSVKLEDEGLQQTYGTNGHDIFEVEFGPQFFQVAEIDLGLGYYRDTAVTTDADGNASGEETRFTMLPISLDLTLRAHILDEQPLVPFVRAGLDYSLWREAWVVGESKEVNRGAKAGWHWGVGGQLLLDTFARRRASRLEANTGINDTWLTVEYRAVTMEPGEFLFFDNSAGTSFSHTELMVGIKLDY